jgi:hypothetical protein
MSQTLGMLTGWEKEKDLPVMVGKVMLPLKDGSLKTTEKTS